MTGCCLLKSCCNSVRCLTYSPTTISNNTLKCKGEKYNGSRTKNKDKADFQIDSININKEQHATVSDFSAQPRLNQFRGRGARAGVAEPVRKEAAREADPEQGGKTWVMPGTNLLPVCDCWLPTHPLCPSSQSSSCRQLWASAPASELAGGHGSVGVLGHTWGFWHASNKAWGWRAGLVRFIGLGFGLGRKGRRHKATSRANPKHGCATFPLANGRAEGTGKSQQPCLGVSLQLSTPTSPRPFLPTPQEPLQSGAELGRQ